MLIVARALQGVFGALLAPALLAVITTTFTDERERGKAFGIFGSVAAGGGAAGLLLGGVLTEYFSWRWTLYVNTALAAVGVLAALATLGPQGRERGQRMDLAGTVTIAVSLVGLVYGFDHAYEHGWTDPLTLACLTGGALLLAAFLVVESRVAHPILPLRVARLTDPWSLAAGAVCWQRRPVRRVAAADLLPAGEPRFQPHPGRPGFPAADRRRRRRVPGQRRPAASAAGHGAHPGRDGMTAGGLFLLGRIEAADGYASVVLPGVTLVGAGLGLALAVAVNLGIDGVQPEDAAVASATVNAVQQVGGSIGPSLFNTIAGSAFAGYLVSNASATSDERLRALATVHSYSVSFDVAAAIVLGTAIVGAAMLRRRRDPAAADPTTTKADLPTIFGAST